MAETTRKNEFEIASDYVTAITKMAADQASRLASLAAAAAPPMGKYSFGDFLLDQMHNSTKLMETVVEASKQMTQKAGEKVKEAATKAADATGDRPRRKSSSRRASKA